MEKNYINGFVIKEKLFDNGGKILKVSVKVDDFVEQLREIESKGWANLNIAKRKEPSDKGVTHYVYEDQWKPEKDYNETNDPQWDNKKTDDMPF